MTQNISDEPGIMSIIFLEYTWKKKMNYMQF